MSGTKSQQDELIELRSVGGVVVASFHRGGFKDEKQILATLERLGKIIDSRKAVRMVVDMTRIDYLSSAGLGRMVSLLKKAMATGGSLYLACMNEQIRELFEVMRLTQIFRIFPTVEAGVEAFE